MQLVINDMEKKIIIMGKSRGDFTTQSVSATIVDIGIPFTTFVHLSPAPDGGFPMDKWSVTEESTGCSITGGHTKKSAIENATSKAREVGARGMQIAIENRRKYLTDHGIALLAPAK